MSPERRCGLDRVPRCVSITGVLAVVSGASCAGKSTVASHLSERLEGVSVHDFDEGAGSPPFDRAWRRMHTERWLQHALELQKDGRDLLLLGGVTGEVLASASATDVAGFVFGLLDCADTERAQRLRERGSVDEHEIWNHVVWGVWLRCHAADPAWFDGPIRGDGGGDLAWSRWEGWRAGDPRWQIDRFDTTSVTPEMSADEIAAWFRARSAERDTGTLPLAGGWWNDTNGPPPDS